LDISGWEFMTLGVIAVIVFGPDRLPKAAADAGRFMKQVRSYVNGAKEELTRELGPEFADVKVSDLTPRGMMKKALGPDDPFEELKNSVDIRKDVEQFRDLRNPMFNAIPKEVRENNGGLPGASELAERVAERLKAEARPSEPVSLQRPTASARVLSDNEIPPVDLDAT
jgi:sec-independent protein translocase protein TatB